MMIKVMIIVIKSRDDSTYEIICYIMESPLIDDHDEHDIFIAFVLLFLKLCIDGTLGIIPASKPLPSLQSFRSQLESYRAWYFFFTLWTNRY